MLSEREVSLGWRLFFGSCLDRGWVGRMLAQSRGGEAASGRDNQKRSRLEVVVPTGKMYRRRVGEGGRREEQNKGDDGSDHPHGFEKRTSKLDRRTKKTDPPCRLRLPTPPPLFSISKFSEWDCYEACRTVLYVVLHEKGAPKCVAAPWHENRPAKSHTGTFGDGGGEQREGRVELFSTSSQAWRCGRLLRHQKSVEQLRT